MFSKLAFRKKNQVIALAIVTFLTQVGSTQLAHAEIKKPKAKALAKKAAPAKKTEKKKDKAEVSKPVTAKPELTQSQDTKSSLLNSTVSPLVPTPVGPAMTPSSPVINTVSTEVMKDTSSTPSSHQPKMIFGLEVGGNIESAQVKPAGQESQAFQSGLGSAYGISFSIPVKTNRWSVGLGAQYLTRVINSDSIYQSFKTNWLKFSPTVSYWILPQILSASGGTYVAVPFGDIVREEIDTGIRTSTRQLNSAFRTDYGVSFAVGGRARFNPSTLFLFETRYNHGLANVIHQGNAQSVPGLTLEDTRIRELQVMMGLGLEVI